MPITEAEPGSLILETDRLRLHRIAISDAAELSESCQDWESVRYTASIPHPYPEGEAERFVGSAVDKWDTDTFWLMAARSKEDGAYIGQLGLTPEPETGQAEISYLLARPAWGKGYGTEMAHAGLTYGFKHRGLTGIFARVFLENEASNRLCQRIGMKFREIGTVDAFARDKIVEINWYDLSRADWEAENA